MPNSNFLFSDLKNQFIKFPLRRQELEELMDEFEEEYKIPQIVGAVDGCHIEISAPPDNREDYFNRKQHYSVNLQAIVNCSLKFMSAHYYFNHLFRLFFPFYVYLHKRVFRRVLKLRCLYPAVHFLYFLSISPGKLNLENVYLFDQNRGITARHFQLASLFLLVKCALKCVVDHTWRCPSAPLN